MSFISEIIHGQINLVKGYEGKSPYREKGEKNAG